MEGNREEGGRAAAVATTVRGVGSDRDAPSATALAGPSTGETAPRKVSSLHKPAPGSAPRGTLLAGVSQIVSSHVVLGAAGVLTLPVLARNFGPAAYGHFSLFVTVLGVVAYQDFARQLLVHEQARGPEEPRDLDALSRLSTGAIVALSIVAGLMILPPVGALLLTVATLLHGLASRDWAALSYAGRVGTATALRNCAWAFAFTLVTVLSFQAKGPWAYAGPFVLANLGILIGYRILGRHLRRRPARTGRTGSRLARAIGWTRLRRSPSWPHYRREIANLFGFTVASSVMVSADRVMLEKTAGGSAFGHYVGHADLAVKMHILSTALASTLYPMLARTVAEQDEQRAARRFVSIATWAVLAYFAVSVALVLFEREVVGLVLGADFLEGPRFYSLMMVGIFVQVFGYLITPWQRARAATSRPSAGPTTGPRS